MKKDGNLKRDLKDLSLIVKINFSLITPILAGFYFGRFLDSKLSTNGNATIISTILGAISGFLYLLKYLKKINK